MQYTVHVPPVLSFQEQECVALQREVSVKTDQSYALRKDADNLAYELTKLRDEKNLDQDEINRLRDAVAAKERECQDKSDQGFVHHNHA